MRAPPVTPAVLGDELLREIAGQGGVRHFPANAVLINEGDASDSLYILLSGRVKVYSTSAEGKEIVITAHGAGEYVGELALDGGLRSASVMTLEPTTCSVVTAGNLRRFIDAHPDFAHHLILKLIRRVRQATDSVKSLALQDVYGRVVQFLYQESTEVDGVRTLNEPLTQQQIAERVGSSREMVSRILKDLRAGGYVSQTRGRLTIERKLPAAW
ncbi:cyclic nucleotide-binding domain-containing protein [Piscinibacter koreensis]|uniref:Crp/Fnr family transcriptional regulator n=1 Tax=Piscinibacter koreensis TaxID=2742824 RepID=A0A7Y6TWE4_9BURK|nr:Crp/Fnr family transcriptional regulator [Schlegelella koreensis]